VSGPQSYVETISAVVEALEQARSREVKVLRGSTGGASQTNLTGPSTTDVTATGEVTGP
jgi:hypothetical protein